MNHVSTNTMESLKESIRERHSRMEALPYIGALTNGSLPLQSYVSQLRTMAVIHGALEHELRLLNLPEVTAVFHARPSRLAHLRADLAAFDHLYLPDCLEALEHARKIAEQIRLSRIEAPAELLGIVYALEGMTLGNAVHLPDVMKTFGEQVAGATRYYAGYGDRTAEYWREFLSAMNALPLVQSGYERMEEATHRLFDRLEAMYGALYPVENSEWGFTAGMLNPEAGQHPVPTNTDEIRAATVAARRCREEFPYFSERYGERGKGFARSDSAWLITLAELSESQRLQQVQWLGRVLANRGMPRITLERQLELVVEELNSAAPSQRGRRQPLREAAEHLKAERLSLIPEENFNRLARQFHIATDGELQGRLKNTGKLIVAAVCDEAAGITEAVDSLLSWLTDPERFSDHWISEVTKTVALARRELLIK